jgi:hypothetical protein
MRNLAITAACVAALIGAAFALLGGVQSPVISAWRYTLEIEVAGQRYAATSVIEASAYTKPKWQFEIGQQYAFRGRGEGLGIRLADGRALVVKTPASGKPRGYESYNREVVERFLTEGQTFPIELDPRRSTSGPPRGFVLDDAVAPRAAWPLDWLSPDRVLGKGARIVRFDMTPTRDGPTFDIGKSVPWIVIDRRKSPREMFVDATDSWRGFHAFRAKLRIPATRNNAKPVVLSSNGRPSDWLDATEAFSSTSSWKTGLVTDVRQIGSELSRDLSLITLGSDDESSAASPFVQRSRLPHPENDGLWNWTPSVCIPDEGCVDILSHGSHGARTSALISTKSDVVWVIEHDNFTTAAVEFQTEENRR